MDLMGRRKLRVREGGKLVRNMETWGRGAYRDGEGSMKKWVMGNAIIS